MDLHAQRPQGGAATPEGNSASGGRSFLHPSAPVYFSGEMIILLPCDGATSLSLTLSGPPDMDLRSINACSRGRAVINFIMFINVRALQVRNWMRVPNQHSFSLEDGICLFVHIVSVKKSKLCYE